MADEGYPWDELRSLEQRCADMLERLIESRRNNRDLQAEVERLRAISEYVRDGDWQRAEMEYDAKAKAAPEEGKD